MTTVQFRAPWSGTVHVITIWAVGIVALAIAGGIWVSLTSGRKGIESIVLLPLLLAAALAYRVRGYTLTEDAILVRRLVGAFRLPLADLQSVTGDVDAMRSSVCLLGNWGVFSITGRHWSRKLGSYRAFATDPSRAVVLRYSNETVVITPHDPQHFIMRARTLIKAADFPK